MPTQYHSRKPDPNEEHAELYYVCLMVFVGVGTLAYHAPAYFAFLVHIIVP